MSKECLSCKKVNPDNARFCVFCRSAFPAPKAVTPGLCPAGKHSMDPTWRSCPYCRMEQEEQEMRLQEEQAASFPAHPAAAVAPPEQPKPSTRPDLQQHAGSAAPGHTVQAESGVTSRLVPGTSPRVVTDVPEEESGLRVTGILVSYTWHPEGRIHALLNDRVTIGRRGDCSVQVPNDPLMSSLHAVLEWRDGVFVLDDADSLNGTQLDNEIVSAPVTLHNYARIRTGSTEWIFILVEPPPR